MMRRFGGVLALALVMIAHSTWTPHAATPPLQATAVRPLTQSKESQAAITPAMALKMLKDGNARFTSGTMLERDLLKQAKATSTGQYPYASVVSCIDSRAAPELIFDQGIGDIFSSRIAGNFVNDDIIGSLEFASKLAGARLIVVLGHTECGGIKGACDNAQLGLLTGTLKNIKPAVDAVPDDGSPRNSKNHAFVQKVADVNVKLAVKRIPDRSAVLREMVQKGELMIVGAMLDLSNGKVTFFDKM